MGMNALDSWHQLLATQDAKGLQTLIAENAVFHSPVVHTPQIGRTLTTLYLSAAFKVFYNDTFRYVREVVGPTDAILEFEVEIDGIKVNGVDMMKWNTDSQIVDFKVMLRPLKAVNLIHQKMAAMLEAFAKRSAD